MNNSIIQTERLILRPWQESDFAPFAAMNADPLVREFFYCLLSKEESDQFALEFKKALEERGWGLWATALVSDPAKFMGFIGITPINFTAHFTPVVEIGWRLAVEFWGKGYATEGAQAVLDYAFNTLKLDEIVA